MKTHGRPGAALALAVVAAVALVGCGGGAKGSPTSTGGGTSSGTSTSPSSGGVAGGTVNMVQGSFPDSLDPQAGTTPASAATWASYTGLLTYAHAGGVAGARLIAGLATSLPRITDHGRTYTLTLRAGQRYSDGQPVRATDFMFSCERAVKVPWGGASEFLDPTVVGARAYSEGRARSIAGITADNATGQIVIHLTGRDGAFDNVLAEPALGLIPAGSRPLRSDPLNPPPGDGPYMIKNVVANRSYSVIKNPDYRPLPGVPRGTVDINVRVWANLAADADAVLNNTADIFDSADTVPSRVLGLIRTKAPSRFTLTDAGGATDYIFLNQAEKPFSSRLVREAVVTGLSEDVINRLGSGTLAPACLLLGPAVLGHATGATCPYSVLGGGDLTRARALVKRSGMAGQPVTVWSPARSPREAWMAYYTRFLNSIGLEAVEKPVAAASYFSTVGELRLHPQTGFADWQEAFPDPVGFYGALLDGHAIRQSGNENLGEIDDPHVNAEIAKLRRIPTTQLQRDASQWQALDEYVAREADVAVLGEEKVPVFASTRMNYAALRISPVYGWDLTSFQLK